MFHAIAHALNSISPEAWGILATTVTTALVSSPVVQGLKKWFQVDEEKKVLFLVMLVSMASAAVAYLITVPQFAPWFILAQGWLTLGTSIPLYVFFLKPLFQNLGAWFTGKLAEAAAINEAKAAAVPAAGLPTASTEDFSH